MAAIWAAETFGLEMNQGPRPNSPDNFNHTTDTGRENLRTMLVLDKISVFNYLGCVSSIGNETERDVTTDVWFNTYNTKE